MLKRPEVDPDHPSAAFAEDIEVAPSLCLGERREVAAQIRNRDRRPRPSARGLPIGVQIAGPEYGDLITLHAARFLEAAGYRFSPPEGYGD